MSDCEPVQRGTKEAHERLAAMAHAAHPGTMKERWDACCVTHLIGALLATGHDITIFVGERKATTGGHVSVCAEGGSRQ